MTEVILCAVCAVCAIWSWQLGKELDDIEEELERIKRRRMF